MENVITVFEQIYQSTYDKAAFYVLSKCGTVPEGFVMQLAKSKVYRYYSERERQKAPACHTQG